MVKNHPRRSQTFKVIFYNIRHGYRKNNRRNVIQQQLWWWIFLFFFPIEIEASWTIIIRWRSLLTDIRNVFMVKHLSVTGDTFYFLSNNGHYHCHCNRICRMLVESMKKDVNCWILSFLLQKLAAFLCCTHYLILCLKKLRFMHV